MACSPSHLEMSKWRIEIAGGIIKQHTFIEPISELIEKLCTCSVVVVSINGKHGEFIVFHPACPDVKLTEREREVMELLAEGFSNVELAEALQVERSTANWYVRKLKTKYGEISRFELMKMACLLEAKGKIESLINGLQFQTGVTVSIVEVDI